MGAKITLTPEQIDNIITLHKETGNYTEVGRKTGYSPMIIKRIITEAAETYNQDIPYVGLTYEKFYDALYYLMQKRNK